MAQGMTTRGYIARIAAKYAPQALVWLVSGPYPHDELLNRVLRETNVGETRSWVERGGYSFPVLSEQMQELFQPYKIDAAFSQLKNYAAI